MTEQPQVPNLLWLEEAVPTVCMFLALDNEPVFSQALCCSFVSDQVKQALLSPYQAHIPFSCSFLGNLGWLGVPVERW